MTQEDWLTAICDLETPEAKMSTDDNGQTVVVQNSSDGQQQKPVPVDQVPADFMTNMMNSMMNTFKESLKGLTEVMEKIVENGGKNPGVVINNNHTITANSGHADATGGDANADATGGAGGDANADATGGAGGDANADAVVNGGEGKEGEGKEGEGKEGDDAENADQKRTPDATNKTNKDYKKNNVGFKVPEKSNPDPLKNYAGNTSSYDSLQIEYRVEDVVSEGFSSSVSVTRTINRYLPKYYVLSESVYDDGDGRRTNIDSIVFRKNLHSRSDVMNYVKDSDNAVIRKFESEQTYSVHNHKNYVPSAATPLYESIMLLKFNDDGAVTKRVYLGNHKVG